QSIWGSGPNDVWALGGTGIARKRSDGSWTTEFPGPMSGLQKIWGSGPNDVYTMRGPEIFHTTGDGKWSAQTVQTVDPFEGLFSVWGSGPDDVYFGSSHGGLYHSLGDGRWFRETVDPEIRLDIESIWGTSKNNVYIYANGRVYHGR
ncbi:MAG TPA: hypothetical protein VIY86_12750, partial [Pirellulaceae bacterium]